MNQSTGKESIKLSVVVPIYNTEDYLCRCVDSLLRQSYSLLEIILVDDGSTDSCGEKCDLYALKDARIKVIHKMNGGQVSARREGVRKASGDYITFVDSDDWIESNAYEDMVGKLEIYHPDVLTYGTVKDYESGLSINRVGGIPSGIYSSEQFWERMSHVRENGYFFSSGISVAQYTKIIKAQLAKDWQERVEETIRYGEDSVLMYWAITHAETIYVETSCFYHYCVRKNSVCWEEENENYSLCTKAIQNFKEAYDDSGKKSIAKRYMIDLSFFFLLNFCMRNCFEKDGRIITFPDIARNSRIILYGKGVFANQFSKCVKETGYLEVVANIDGRDAEKLRDIIAEAYDYIVLGITEPNIVKEATQLLAEAGIMDCKIRYIDKESLTIDKLPAEIRHILEEDFYKEAGKCWMDYKA